MGERGATEDRCHRAGLTGWPAVSSGDGTHSRILGKESRVWRGARCGHGACCTLAAACSASLPEGPVPGARARHPRPAQRAHSVLRFPTVPVTSPLL